MREVVPKNKINVVRSERDRVGILWWQTVCSVCGDMAAPLDEFQHKIVSTVLSAMIPAMVIVGLIGVFKRDVENWIVATLRALIHGKPNLRESAKRGHAS